MWLFKLLGIAAALFAAAVVSRRYSEYITLRAELTRGFSELLMHIKNKISVTLAPPSELIEGFESEPLSRVGFISRTRELGSPKEAYRDMSRSLPLSEGTRRVLDGYFSGFGGVYFGELIRLTEAAHSSLAEIAEAECRTLPREKKLSRTVIFAVALGAVILLI